MRKVITLLLVCMISVPAMQSADAAILERWNVAYSQEDTKRYDSILSHSVPYVAQFWFETEIILERGAKYEAEYPRGEGESTDYMQVLPQTGYVDIQVALHSSYAALEDKYGLKDEDLTHFFPEISCIMLENEPVWKIWMSPRTDETFETLGSYAVYVSAENGDIVRMTSAEDAQG